MRRTLLAFICLLTAIDSASAQVDIVNTPNRGIQPQAVMDAKGTLHLLYYDGDPRNGNLMYIKREAGKTDFTAPLQVNSQQGSAIAVGTIRGGHLALGKNGRVHVAWNGSMKAEPKNALGGHPMMYARLNDKGTAFEAQRNLMTQTSVLDGGGTLAADPSGNVFVAWHATGKDDGKGEHHRKVWLALSKDDGKTFAAETPIDSGTGACGCCGMRGFADSDGSVYFLYRAASERINRGMYALKSSGADQRFLAAQLDNWKIATCPMSSEAMAQGPGGVMAAWENEGQIFFRNDLFTKNKTGPEVRQAPGNGGNRQHPALAFNKKGEMILVWTEGTGWQRGGSLHWQVYDKDFTPRDAGRRPGAIPVWGLPAVVAEADGRFTILH